MSAAGNGNGMDRARELMMRSLDEEISDSQRAELEHLIASDESVKSELERLVTVKKQTSHLRLQKPPDKLWEGYMDSVYRRVERGIGWILLSVGAIILLSYGLWRGIQELIGDITVPWFVKGGVIALLIGFVILIVSVIREKYFIFQDDPYRNVRR